MIFCGKKCAMICSMISVWGILMLTLMGVLLYSHAIAFAEDLGLEVAEFEGKSKNEFRAEAYVRYGNAAHNCWIAVCLYIITLAVSMHQYYLNRKVQYGM